MTVADITPNVDELAALADALESMTLQEREDYLATCSDQNFAVAREALRQRHDPLGTSCYRDLGYEPICIPRVQAALDAGHRTPLEAEAAGMADLPAACGQCPAERFDASMDFDVLFGGAAGGSKTKSSLMFGIRCMKRWPGFRSLLLRETYDELDENVYPELRAIDYAVDIGGKWNAGRRQLDIGRSAMRFRYMHDLDDIRRRRGGSYQLILLDERNQLPAGTADALRDRLRSADPSVPVVGFRSTANPGGKSHSELKQNYVKPDPRLVKTTMTEHGDRVTTIENPETGATFQRLFIPAKSTDNPYLGPSYEREVLGLIEDPVLRRAMRDGDWDVFVGQYFGEWRADRHVVPRGAIELSRGWPRLEGIDYGRAKPFCMLRAAVDGDKRVWVYSELYKAGMGEREQAAAILADEAAHGDARVRRAGDPSMWNKTQDAPDIASTYREVGVRMIKADNTRTTGWARVHTFLAEWPACPYHAAKGWETCPRLHVFEGAAPNLVRTLPDLPFSHTKVEDLDTDSEDHAADALRYLLMQARTRQKRKLSGQQQREATAASV